MIRGFARHPTAANILMLAILALGFAALPTLQRDTFPVVPSTEVEVGIAYPGATSAEVERGVCMAVEDDVRAVDDLQSVSCLSLENRALLSAEMLEGADIQRFYDDVMAAIEGIDNLPNEVEPAVGRIVERVASVATVAITGTDDPFALVAYAEGLAERLGNDPRIARATVSGFSDREISVETSLAALQRHELTLGDIVAALERGSLDRPAGVQAGQQSETAVRFEGERRDILALEATPVVIAENGAVVTLGEVARISTQFSDPWQASYFDGQRAALVTITKSDTQDALQVMSAVQSHLDEERANAPGDIRLTISQDTTANIRERLRIIAVNGVQGLILVLVTMWLFFGRRLSFWVSMGLPVSFLGAVFAMQLFGLTINMMTMVALLVAIGLLMDDAIVIAENIDRRRLMGESPLQASVNGTVQVAPGVLASFLTTVMIVGPLAFMTGDIGAVLKFIPFTLVIVLVVSLIEAFLILPNHLGHAIKAEKPGRITRTVNLGLDRVRDKVVLPLSDISLRYRYLTIGCAGFLLLFSIAPYAGGLIKFQSFPQLESDTVEARLLLPQGTPLERTEQRVAKVVAALVAMDADLTPQQPGAQSLVQNFTISYGVNVDTPETGANMATVSAQLLPAGVRRTDVATIVDMWKRETGPLPDMVALRFTDKERGVGGKPIDVRLQGETLEELEAAAIKLRRFFLGFAGVRDVTFNLQPGKPEYVVRLKDGAASTLGISARDLSGELRAAFRGDTGLELRDEHGVSAVRVRLAGDSLSDQLDIAELRVRAADGAFVPLSAVADIDMSRGYASVERIDGRRTVAVQGAINPDVANARELMSAMKAEFLPQLLQEHPSVSVVVAGEALDVSSTGASLARNLAIGILGVYLILAYQFRSFVQPVAVIAVIPLGIVGVIWGHMALGLQISLPSLVGLATLAGVVVNDSILLVEFIKQRLDQGDEIIKAARDAAGDRFRAIFLTSLTTVVGLAPLLLEQSTQAQFLRPIVASLAFGLTGATLLALFVTPAVFVALADFRFVRASAGDQEIN